MKKLIVIGLMSILLTGCGNSNEDPTDIDLQVLRASLLEKELYIDELQKGIEETQNEKDNLSREVANLLDELEDERLQKIKLLDAQPQIMSIHYEKDHYFDTVEDTLYILMQYKADEFGYEYEELFRFRKDRTMESVYRGTEVQFSVELGTGHIIVLDGDLVSVLNNDLTSLIRETIDLNDPLIELSPKLYLQDEDDGKSYIMLSKTIQDDTESLLAIISFDYKSDDDVKIQKYYLNTKKYVLDAAKSTLFYEELAEDGIYLYKLDFDTDIREAIAVNLEQPIDLHFHNGQIYYFDEERNTVIRYDYN